MNSHAPLNRRILLRAGLGFAGLLLTACGGDDDDAETLPTATSGGSLLSTPTTGGESSGTTASGDQATQPAVGGTQAGVATQPAGATTPPQPGEATSTVIPSSPAQPDLTPEELQQFKPNELGQVPILEYHQFGAPPEQFMRTPDQFRSDLQWLYDHNFYVIKLREFLDDRISAPLGKRPVILTFDDSHVAQFRLSPLANGQFALDPECAIGIMEAFFAAHPDFGRGGVFGILPHQLFNWPSEPEQNEFGEVKVNWLVDNGYELSNHSYDHVSLAELSESDIIYQLCAWNDWVHSIRPDVAIDSITLPYGMYPVGPNGPGDDTLFRGCEYEGRQYSWRCALQIGANPAIPAIALDYDPYAVARIQAFDEELYKWFDLFESDPGILYVSDGNPNTVTIPNDLHPWLAGTLDESKVGDRTLVRY